jgi:hypothetical protein
MNSNKNASSSGSSPLSKIIFFILLILFIFIILYIIYYAYQRSQYINENQPIIIADITNATKSYSTNLSVTPKDGMTQSLSTWIYVKNWDYNVGKYKNIIWKTDTSTPNTGNPSHTPSLWLYPLTNNLKVITSVETQEGVESCDINNIPLMKWVHIVYVLNNRTVDVYINGKLERSCALKGIPKALDTSKNFFVTYGNPAGYNGSIGKTQYFTKALQPNEVASMYLQGPIGSSQYNIQFFQDGKFIQVKDQSSINETS